MLDTKVVMEEGRQVAEEFEGDDPGLRVIREQQLGDSLSKLVLVSHISFQEFMAWLDYGGNEMVAKGVG
jgi:hypothetical protein